MKKAFIYFLPIILTISFVCFLLFQPKKGSMVIPRELTGIVSLSPSITREIIDLDAKELIVGITSYDDSQDNTIEIVGSLVTPNIEKIVSLKPDIIFLTSEDNPVQNFEKLSITGIPYYIFRRNYSLNHIEENYMELAKMLHKEDLAHKKISKYRRQLKISEISTNRPRIFLVISISPMVAVSDGSLIGKMIEDAGGDNIITNFKIPYPIISLEKIIKEDPDIIIGIFPEDEKTIKNLLKDFPGLNAMRNNNIYGVKPDHLSYCTPFDYVTAVKELNEIFKKSKIDDK